MLVNEPDSNFLCLGLLQPAQSLVMCGLSLTFNFLHLTFQEYLAALHLATFSYRMKRNWKFSMLLGERIDLSWCGGFSLAFVVG